MLSDLERRDAKGHFFLADLRKYMFVPFVLERPNSARLSR